MKSKWEKSQCSKKIKWRQRNKEKLGVVQSSMTEELKKTNKANSMTDASNWLTSKGAKIQAQQRAIRRRWYAFDTAGHFQDFRWNVFVEVTSTLHMHSSERRKDSSPCVIMKFVI